MSYDPRLAEILACVQIDPGQRGLARDPVDNLFTAFPDDFAKSCLSIAEHPDPYVNIVTGFMIPSVDPPRFETDGPLGALFLACSLFRLGIPILITTDPGCGPAIEAGLKAANIPSNCCIKSDEAGETLWRTWLKPQETEIGDITHTIALERVGPGTDGRARTMRGRDITALMQSVEHLFVPKIGCSLPWETIGIGDGGNEIGMGKMPLAVIEKNIPNGPLIHSQIATDLLIVAGVSNWGAYALAAGISMLRKTTSVLYDADLEEKILGAMVEFGMLIDGVTGQASATVDGLTWQQYIAPFQAIRAIIQRNHG